MSSRVISTEIGAMPDYADRTMATKGRKMAGFSSIMRGGYMWFRRRRKVPAYLEVTEGKEDECGRIRVNVSGGLYYFLPKDVAKTVLTESDLTVRGIVIKEFWASEAKAQKERVLTQGRRTQKEVGDMTQDKTWKQLVEDGVEAHKQEYVLNMLENELGNPQLRWADRCNIAGHLLNHYTQYIIAHTKYMEDCYDTWED